MKIAIAMAILLLLVGLSVPFIARTLEERRHAAGQEQLEALRAETRKSVARSEAQIEQANRDEEFAIASRGAITHEPGRSCSRQCDCSEMKNH